MDILRVEIAHNLNNKPFIRSLNCHKIDLQEVDYDVNFITDKFSTIHKAKKEHTYYDNYKDIPIADNTHLGVNFTIENKLIILLLS